MNGHFIFDDETSERAPPLEEALRQLPIVANPSLTVTAERQAEKAGENADEVFRDRIYFEVRDQIIGKATEYVVTPLRTYHITGVMSYELRGRPSNTLRVLSAWTDLLEVEFARGNGTYLFNLLFAPYNGGVDTDRK